MEQRQHKVVYHQDKDVGDVTGINNLSWRGGINRKEKNPEMIIEAHHSAGHENLTNLVTNREITIDFPGKIRISPIALRRLWLINSMRIQKN